MRCFNVIPHFMASNLLLASIFCAPIACLATERVPDEGASIYQGIYQGISPGVSAEQWDAPCMDAQVSRESEARGSGCRERPQERPQRSGETVATLPGLLAVMQQVMRQPDKSVALHYPESEQGERWVEELRDWLVALGLSSDRIQVMPGSADDMINVMLAATISNPANGQNTAASPPSSIMVEPFQVKEATDAGNGVEIP